MKDFSNHYLGKLDVRRFIQIKHSDTLCIKGSHLLVKNARSASQRVAFPTNKVRFDKFARHSDIKALFLMVRNYHILVILHPSFPNLL